jgi:hypothetical protein
MCSLEADVAPKDSGITSAEMMLMCQPVLSDRSQIREEYP